MTAAERALLAMRDASQRDRKHDEAARDLRRLFADPELGPSLCARRAALLAEVEAGGGAGDHERDSRASELPPEHG